MGRLDGKVALISGGARGQGATEAHLFAREGAKVVLGDIRDTEGKQVEAEIRAAGGEATYVYLDVTSDADWVEKVFVALPDVPVAVDDPRHHGLGGRSGGGGHSSPPACFPATRARVCSYLGWPPSTKMATPMLQLLSLEARKMTVPTRASSFWMRGKTRCLRPRSKNAGPPTARASSLVVRPGIRVDTQILEAG
jgi:hypothetical protein